MFGKNTKENRRKVYYLHGQAVLPTFFWAGQLALDPGDLHSHIDELKAEGREAQLRRREKLRAEAEAEVRRVRTRPRRARVTSSNIRKDSRGIASR
jgi:hypothetical protein